MSKDTQSNWNVERARNWHLFMPPARPSKGEMAHYERVVLSEAKSDSNRWALLGSTPEIRSLASKYQRELLCIDNNADVFEALRSMVEFPYSEIFICSDWLNAQVPRPVDIVFADGSINMLPLSKHEELLKKIYDILNPQGLALLRVHLVGPPKFSSPQEVFKWYRTSKIDEPVFSATRTHLDMLWIDPETLKLNFSEYHKKIQQLYDNKFITVEEFDGYNRLLQFNRIDLYYTKREFFEHSALNYFQIESLSYGNDYSGHMNHPLYFLSRKN